MNARPIPFSLFLSALLASCTPGFSTEIDKDRPTSDPISDASLNPWRGDFRTPSDVGLAADEVYFRNTSGKRLRAWLFTADDAEQTVLFCMGNSGNISLMMPYAKILQDAGFEVLMFDYQGFGESEGIASVTSLLTDCKAAMDFLIESRQRERKDIGIFGVSLGSVLALALAAEYQVGAVAVEDIFIPNKEVDRLARHYVRKDDMLAQLALSTLKTVFLQDVDPIRNIKRVSSPVFFMHGINDWLLPPSGTMTVAAACESPKRVWIMEQTGHAPESLEVNETEYESQLQTFFQSAFRSKLEEPTAEIISQTPTTRLGHQKTTVRIACHQNANEPKAVQIVLANDQGRTQFARCFVRAEQHLEIRTAFQPTHISCVAFHDVIPVREDTSWIPRLSRFSACLDAFRKEAHLVFGHERTCEYYFARQGQLFYTNQQPLRKYSPRLMEGLLTRLPDPDTLPERIRARYAGLLARLDRWPRPQNQRRAGDGLSELPFAERMLEYLPEHPEEYYEIGNARFQLEFRDAVVAHSLMELAKRRLRQYKPQEARSLLRKHVAVLPTEVSTSLTPERIASIQTIDDLISPVPSPDERQPQQNNR